MGGSLRPDIVICDLGLPVLDGLQLAVRLRQELPQLPLIALSGYADAATQQRANQAGYARYFVKPVATEALLQAVAHLTS